MLCVTSAAVLGLLPLPLTCFRVGKPTWEAGDGWAGGTKVATGRKQNRVGGIADWDGCGRWIGGARGCPTAQPPFHVFLTLLGRMPAN